MKRGPDLFMQRQAVFMAGGAARLALTRVWDPGKPQAGWLMCNPSLGDGEEDDPTVRRCIHFSQAHGCGSLKIVNLWPLVTPYPTELWAALARGEVTPAMFESNQAEVLLAGTGSAVRFVAFGSGPADRQPDYVAHMIRLFSGGGTVLALRLASAGWPVHPLARGNFAVPKSAKGVPWRWPGSPGGARCRDCRHFSGWLPNTGDCMAWANVRRDLGAPEAMPELPAAAVDADFVCPAWSARDFA